MKRKQGVADARRSRLWAHLAREPRVAARDGGGSPDTNARLALAVERAKAETMPNETIGRAIERGMGAVDGADDEEGTYEGYGQGVAIFMDTLTDTPNRTVADLRSLSSKAGGRLGTSGSVAFLFEQKAVFEIPAGVLRLLDGLDEHLDVQDVTSTLDLSDEMLAALSE